MDFLLVCLVALAAAGLTFFSGFGLGTLLMPAFALFFPLPAAVAATAVVHLANNLFKAALVGRHAHWPTVARFGLPAALAALAGASLLELFNRLPPIVTYPLAGRSHEITAVKLLIACLIAGFALAEMSPRLSQLQFHPRHLPLGGLLSGFFGGLSGHQGALRSAFLIRTGLAKEAFVGTGVLCAVIVDSVRLLVYGAAFLQLPQSTWNPHATPLILSATVAAFAGSYAGARLLHKVTLRTVQVIVGTTLIALALALAAGLV